MIYNTLKVIHHPEEIDGLTMPNPETDGLLPFMLNRLIKTQPAIHDAVHRIRFSVSQGPLNVASFLMVATELMMAMMMEPDRIHRLMHIITDFLKRWHELQRQIFPDIKEIFDAAPSKVKFFHSDTDFRASVRHYPDMGVNLYNPGIQMGINDIKEVAGKRLTVPGSIPPRDVLATGTPEQVER